MDKNPTVASGNLVFDTNNDGNLNKQEMNELKRALTKESNDNMMREDTNELNEIVNDIIENISINDNSQEFNHEDLINDIADELDDISFISFTSLSSVFISSGIPGRVYSFGMPTILPFKS